MLTSQVLPAIPRQNVKHIPSGKIGGVLLANSEYASVVFPSGNIAAWELKDCEIVTEEPRELRIGDKAAYEWQGISGGRSVTYGTVTAVTNYGKKETLYHVDGIRVESPEKIRRTTPEEAAKYFLTA